MACWDRLCLSSGVQRALLSAVPSWDIANEEARKEKKTWLSKGGTNNPS